MKQQSAQSCEQQRGGYIQPRQHGNQNRRAEHGKHVLDPQYYNLWGPQSFGIVDTNISDAFPLRRSIRFLAHELILLYLSDGFPADAVKLCDCRAHCPVNHHKLSAANSQGEIA